MGLSVRLRSLLRAHPALAATIAIQASLSLLTWFSGSLFGTWAFECGIGQIAHDLPRGLNPAVPLQDYYDGGTTGYLLAGLLASPFTLLPIRTIYAVKLYSLLFDAAVLVVAYAFLHRNLGRAAAVAGVILLALCPPLLAYYALRPGDYHYSELLFELGLALVVCEVVLRGRRTGRWYALLGGVAGLAIANCLASAAYVGVAGLLWWCLDKGALRRAGFWLAPPAFALGISPWLHKLLLHTPYGVAEQSLGARGLPPIGRAMLDRLGKEFGLLLEGLPLNLGFTDALGPWALGFGWIWAIAAIAAVFGVLWAGRTGLKLLARGLVSAPELTEAHRTAVGMLVLPAFFVAFVLAWLLSGYGFAPADVDTTALRDNRFLPAGVGFLALNLGAAIGLLVQRRGRGWALLLLPLVGMTLAGQLAMVSWTGLSASEGIPYRGQCTDLQGLFASEVLADRSLLPAEAVQAGVQLCSGFEDASDCLRGYAWGVALGEVRCAPGARGVQCLLTDAGIQRCDALPAGELTRDCIRQVGWSYNHRLRLEPRPAHVAYSGWCGEFGGARASWCLEGMGFWLADELGYAPWKFDVFARPEAGRSMRAAVAKGYGYAITHHLEQGWKARAVCAELGLLDPAIEAPCLSGVATGYAVYGRAWPPQ